MSGKAVAVKGEPALLVGAPFQEYGDGAGLSDGLAKHPLIERAYALACKAHDGQFRRSGEPFISHPVEVARTVERLRGGEAAVAAALLHDVVEDTDVTVSAVEDAVGREVAFMVDSLTKIDRLQFASEVERQAATIRKMLFAIGQNSRVLVIKLADRLHNLRTIAVMPPATQRRTAQETLDIYAPLAHRLGIEEIKWQLEDLSFATLDPQRYAQIARMVAIRTPERDEQLRRAVEALGKVLAREGITAKVEGRPKHLWSIAEKMASGSKEFSEIYDLVGVRVITESEKDCWAALGAIHSQWTPVAGRFKDYVNAPKSNKYQSIHTAVVGHEGKHVEVQIRTAEMHERAEKGIAAHWEYKERGQGSAALRKDEMEWLGGLIADHYEGGSDDPIEFMDDLKLDLARKQVFVFSPKGKLIELPAGATPIDFAYTIHTDVGHRCVGAKVNGRLVPLDTRLKSADHVEIVTSKAGTSGPSRDWLGFAVSSRARNKIRQWFSRELREDSIVAGREHVVKALRREGVSLQRATSSKALEEAVRHYGQGSVDGLFAAVGAGHQSAVAVAGYIARTVLGDGEAEETSVLAETPRASRRVEAAGQTGASVQGLGGVVVHPARCCSPLPGDAVVGFITRGRGVTVHRSECPNVRALCDADRVRLVEVEWSAGSGGALVAGIAVVAGERQHVLADVAKVLSDHHADILSSRTGTGVDRMHRMVFEISVGDPGQLPLVLAALERLDGVMDAYRLIPGRSQAPRRNGRLGGDGFRSMGGPRSAGAKTPRTPR